MSAILKFDFQKKKIAFFWSKLSKLHKKDPILHVTTTFSLKQGETRTSSGLIPHPLTCSWNSDKKQELIQNEGSKEFGGGGKLILWKRNPQIILSGN